jgi:hypothetical protein
MGQTLVQHEFVQRLHQDILNLGKLRTADPNPGLIKGFPCLGLTHLYKHFSDIQSLQRVIANAIYQLLDHNIAICDKPKPISICWQ